MGLAKGAFKFKAVSCAVDTGLSRSLVFVTFPRPTIVEVTPLTVPVIVGEFNAMDDKAPPIFVSFKPGIL